jgi:hypothetical protein
MRQFCPAGRWRGGTIEDVMVMGLGHVLGTDGRTWYDFWSGLGADIGGLAFIGATIGIYRKHNCHVHRCWRIAKQAVVGTSWVVCHRHHPEGRPTAQQVAQVHSRILEAEHAALARATHLATGERAITHPAPPTPD